MTKIEKIIELDSGFYGYMPELQKKQRWVSRYEKAIIKFKPRPYISHFPLEGEFIAYKKVLYFGKVPNLVDIKNDQSIVATNKDNGNWPRFGYLRRKFNGRKSIGRYVLCKLLIPADAERIRPFGPDYKCRASKAKVLGFYDYVLCRKKGYPMVYELELYESSIRTAYSIWDEKFAYKKGQIVEPRGPLNKDPLTECGSGIHFFVDPIDAIKYLY